MRRNRGLTPPARLLVLLLLLAAYGLTGVTLTRPGELAVVRRFGRVLEHKPGPGLWVSLPWGMDRVDRVVVDRLQSVVVGYRGDDNPDLVIPPGQLLTGDHNLVNVQATIYYKVRPEEVADYVAQAGRVEAVLSRTAETVMAEWVAGRTVDDVLLNGKTALREDLVPRIEERFQPYRLGLEVRDARVTLIAPPDEVKDAFDRVAKVQTETATAKYRAEQEAQRLLRQAEADRYRSEQETEAYAARARFMARGDAERFLKRLDQYRLGRRHNPNYLRQIWEEERGKLFARLKENRQLDLLDHHLGADGLDLFTAPPLPGKP
jgi:modulator of FtsH protease HflK